MKVLFDQNLPHKLRSILLNSDRHDIVTAAYMGWSQLKNGELLRAAEDVGIDVFITGDGTLSYEQNLSGRRLSIIVLSTNNWPIMMDKTSLILDAIDKATPGSFHAVDCGKFRR